MNGYIEIEIPSHCLECPVLNKQTDECLLIDYDELPEDEDFENWTWEQQKAHCPIKLFVGNTIFTKEAIDVLRQLP